ncbi:eukaryotic translation initiation factor 4E-binding protein 2 isoform X1 [Gopherus evgoodei]|uniref:eukaryotic translation initiation factor 4E-binding protein 2 isoform X1 n=1 Tax=Gopherus evgoodei TaxID=1825980 RepID=UPI0011CF1ED9|nr:eukaryotic translation initiation factor 4E-binding protein 2 isoform X1 [Gopherus evgoodei]
MSSSGGHQHSQSRAIPTRTVPISDATQLPHDYCTTPGGTLFSTTPGGTRIIYDRKFLLDRRNSPMAQTPPCHLPNIPGVTSPGTMVEDSKVEINNLNNHDRKTAMGCQLKPMITETGLSTLFLMHTVSDCSISQEEHVLP